VDCGDGATLAILTISGICLLWAQITKEASVD